jgi:hypothetical protein
MLAIEGVADDGDKALLVDNWHIERFSSGDLAGLKDVDGLGDLPGASGAAARVKRGTAAGSRRRAGWLTSAVTAFISCARVRAARLSS